MGTYYKNKVGRSIKAYRVTDDLFEAKEHVPYWIKTRSDIWLSLDGYTGRLVYGRNWIRFKVGDWIICNNYDELDVSPDKCFRNVWNIDD